MATPLTPTGLPQLEGAGSTGSAVSRATPKLTIPGTTTYEALPTQANPGDVMVFGDKFRQTSPEAQRLQEAGILSPYTEKGMIFAKPYDAGNLRSQEFTPEGTPYMPGATAPTRETPPNVQYNYTTVDITPDERKRYSSNLSHQLVGLGIKNLPKGPELNYYADAMARGGYTAQDVANDWYQRQTTGSSNIVNPNVQRWHWIVGGGREGGGTGMVDQPTGGAEGGPPTTAVDQPTGGPTTMDQTTGDQYIPGGDSYMANLSKQINLAMGDMGFDSGIQPQEIPDITETANRIFESNPYIQARLQSSEAGYQQLLRDIESQYEGLKERTAQQADVTRGQQRAYLARLGALGDSTQSEAMLQGMRNEKEAAIQDLEQKKMAAKAAAYHAWQTGDTEMLSEAYDKAYSAAVDYTKQLNDAFNNQISAEQLGINKYQAKSNFLLGAYGKLLQAEGLDLDRQGLEQDMKHFSMKMMQDQERIDLMRDEFDDESARAWADITGYYYDPETGQITPTIDMMAFQLKKYSRGTGTTDSSGIPDYMKMKNYVTTVEDPETGEMEVVIRDEAISDISNGKLRDMVYNAANEYADSLNQQKQQSKETTPETTTTDEGIVDRFSGWTRRNLFGELSVEEQIKIRKGKQYMPYEEQLELEQMSPAEQYKKATSYLE